MFESSNIYKQFSENKRDGTSILIRKIFEE